MNHSLLLLLLLAPPVIPQSPAPANNRQSATPIPTPDLFPSGLRRDRIRSSRNPSLPRPQRRRRPRPAPRPTGRPENIRTPTKRTNGFQPRKRCRRSSTGLVCTEHAGRVRRRPPPPLPRYPCTLSVRVYPLLFFGRTATIDFKLLFRSDCLKAPLLQYFMIPWNKNYDLYPHAHPSFIRLIIFGRLYSFKFLEGFERGTFPDINVAYKSVRIHPTRLRVMVNTFEDNSVMLWPPRGQEPFSNMEINRLKTLSNPFSCEIRDKKKVLFCQLG